MIGDKLRPEKLNCLLISYAMKYDIFWKWAIERTSDIPHRAVGTIKDLRFLLLATPFSRRCFSEGKCFWTRDWNTPLKNTKTKPVTKHSHQCYHTMLHITAVSSMIERKSLIWIGDFRSHGNDDKSKTQACLSGNLTSSNLQFQNGTTNSNQPQWLKRHQW